MVHHTWFTPSHVNKNFHMTISELDETWLSCQTKFDSHSLYGFLVMANVLH